MAPCVKKKFARPRDAWGFAIYMFKRYGVDQTVYRCQKCRAFHLTHKRDKQPEWFKDMALKILVYAGTPTKKLAHR